MPTSIEAIRIVSNRMEPLGLSFTFIGGAVLGLLVDDAELSQVRSTKDVDVVVEVLTYGEYAALEARLRKAGFKHDTAAAAIDEAAGDDCSFWQTVDCKLRRSPACRSGPGCRAARRRRKTRPCRGGRSRGT